MAKPNRVLFNLIILLSAGIDQGAKFLVSSKVALHESVPVIPGFFNIVHVKNRGMAFGIFNNPDPGPAVYFLAGASIVAVLLITFWFITLKEKEKIVTPGLALIAGGAIGNLIDRLHLKVVIDFLDIRIGSYHWPAFNIADTCITAGTAWVLICFLFYIKFE